MQAHAHTRGHGVTSPLPPRQGLRPPPPAARASPRPPPGPRPGAPGAAPRAAPRPGEGGPPPPEAPEAGGKRGDGGRPRVNPVHGATKTRAPDGERAHRLAMRAGVVAMRDAAAGSLARSPPSPPAAVRAAASCVGDSEGEAGSADMDATSLQEAQHPARRPLRKRPRLATLCKSCGPATHPRQLALQLEKALHGVPLVAAHGLCLLLIALRRSLRLRRAANGHMGGRLRSSRPLARGAPKGFHARTSTWGPRRQRTLPPPPGIPSAPPCAPASWPQKLPWTPPPSRDAAGRAAT
jgi:hypothetical protein